MYIWMKIFDFKWIRRWDIDTPIHFGDHFVKLRPARSFFDGAIAKNILKGVLLQDVKCRVFII